MQQAGYTGSGHDTWTHAAFNRVLFCIPCSLGKEVCNISVCNLA
jgi:hypothetical protein